MITHCRWKISLIYAKTNNPNSQQRSSLTFFTVWVPMSPRGCLPRLKISWDLGLYLQEFWQLWLTYFSLQDQ